MRDRTKGSTAKSQELVMQLIRYIIRELQKVKSLIMMEKEKC